MPVEITVILMFKVINAFVAMAQVYITAGLFDTAGNFLEGNTDKNTLLLWCGAFIAIFALPLLLDLIERPVNDLSIFTKHHMFIYNLHARVVSMPLIRFEESEFHNEIQRAKMCVYNTGLLNYFYGFTDFVPHIFRFIGTVGVLAAFSITFVPLAFISIIPSFIRKWIYSREIYRYDKTMTQKKRCYDYLWDIFTGKDTVKELRTMNTEDYFKRKWISARDEWVDAYFNFEMKQTTVFMLCDTFKLLAYACSIALAIFYLTKGIITIGQFSACIVAFSSMQFMAETLAGMITEQNRQADFAGDYYDFFDNATETDGDTKYNSLTDKIEVKNLSFAYPKSENDVLKNVSFTIKKGERVVIVGENGSGKTTLSKIIAGVYEPKSGEVLYDNKNVSTFERGSFYRQFSVISQDFVKYQLSMRENIGMSTLNRIHDDDRLMRSAKAANIENIVNRIGGFDTQLGREFDGVELSGGEWQKVAIARGLNKDSDIIILDEPTSALDPLVEYDILSKFICITQGKTSIIISHRVGLCKFADRIIVMKNGEAVENGTHEQLLLINGVYSRIWNEQAKWYV